MLTTLGNFVSSVQRLEIKWDAYVSEAKFASGKQNRFWLDPKTFHFLVSEMLHLLSKRVSRTAYPRNHMLLQHFFPVLYIYPGSNNPRHIFEDALLSEGWLRVRIGRWRWGLYCSLGKPKRSLATVYEGQVELWKGQATCNVKRRFLLYVIKPASSSSVFHCASNLQRLYSLNKELFKVHWCVVVCQNQILSKTACQKFNKEMKNEGNENMPHLLLKWKSSRASEVKITLPWVRVNILKSS